MNGGDLADDPLDGQAGKALGELSGERRQRRLGGRGRRSLAAGQKQAEEGEGKQAGHAASLGAQE